MKIIGLSGKKCSGKTTVAKMLYQALNKKGPIVYLAGFADGVKMEVAEATGMPLVAIEQLKKEFRPILQWWGTDFRRKLCRENYWIEQMAKRLKKIKDNSIVIIHDVRFQNEAAFVHFTHKGTLIRVERPSVLEADAHESENALDKYTFDYTIVNDGTLEDLTEKVLDYLEKHPTL